MPKSDKPSVLHGWPAFLFAGLLEGQPAVRRYAPAIPIQYRTGKKCERHTPDLLVDWTNGTRQVVDITRRATTAQSPPVWLPAVTDWCEAHGYDYDPISAESIESQWRLALNWVRITRWLVETDGEYGSVMSEINAIMATQTKLSVGQLIRHFDALPERDVVVAICALLHTGHLGADLTHDPFTIKTLLTVS